MIADVYVVTTIELESGELKGEALTVAAPVRFAEDGIGLRTGRIRGWVGAIGSSFVGPVEMPLTGWEETLARTKIEAEFLRLFNIAWEDRAA